MKKAFTLSEALVTLAIIGVLAAILIPVINNARPDKDKIVYKKALYSLQNAVSNAMEEAETSGESSIYWGPNIGGSYDWIGGSSSSVTYPTNSTFPSSSSTSSSSTTSSGGTSGSTTSSTSGGSSGSSAGKSFCEAVAESLNTRGAVDCTSTSSYDSPNFITTDGIRYWGLEDDSTFSTDSDHSKVIYVDRKATDGELRGALARLRDRTISPTDKSGMGLKIKVRRDGKVYTPDDTNYEYENDLIETSLDVTQRR